jgi:fucose permease
MKEMEYLLCFMFFLYVGEETAFGGWISPYAVLQKVSDKDQATTFSSFFWISIAIFRFVASFINKKTSEKFNFLLKSYIISTLIVIVFLQLNLVYLSCIFSSFAFGVCTSSFYGLILSLPS